MDGLQSALSGLPSAGMVVVGAALAAGLGGAGFLGAGALAPGAQLCRVLVRTAAGTRIWSTVQRCRANGRATPLPPRALRGGPSEQSVIAWLRQLSQPIPAPPASLLAESARQVAKYAAGAAGAALGAVLAKQLAAKRAAAAIVELANLLVSLGDPTQLTREQVRLLVGDPADALPPLAAPRCGGGSSGSSRRPGALPAFPALGATPPPGPGALLGLPCCTSLLRAQCSSRCTPTVHRKLTKLAPGPTSHTGCRHRGQVRRPPGHLPPRGSQGHLRHLCGGRDPSWRCAADGQ